MDQTEQASRQQSEAAEWATEGFLADPTFVSAVLIVVTPMVPFLALSWVVEVFLGIGWLQAILGLLVAIYLVHGCPSALAEELPMPDRIKFEIPLWIARTALMLVLFATWFGFIGMPGWSRWVFVALMTVVVIPIMWFPLLQIRQFGMMSMIGVVPAGYLPLVMLISLSQVGAWGTAIVLWFGDFRSIVALGGSVAAIVWHLLGSFVLVTLSVRNQWRFAQIPTMLCDAPDDVPVADE